MEETLLGSEKEDTRNLKGRIWKEAKIFGRVAFPAMLTSVTTFGILVVTQAFVGHVGELELAAYAIVQTIAVRFGNGILLGMSSATRTLCGQAFGAGQYHMLGIYLQRCWIIVAFCATLLVPLFVFAAPIFKLLGEEDDIANEAGKLSLWFIHILYYFAFSITTQAFLQAQLRNLVVGVLASASFALHVLLSWLFVSVFSWGIPGAMSAMIISCWFLVISQFVYVFGGWCPDTWTGFSFGAFNDLWPAIKLSLSSGVMICVELWYNAILVLIAGYMKNAETAISAFSICLNLVTWELMMCLGFQGGASVRVSNELGKGNAKAVKFSIKFILCTSISIGVFFWVLVLAFGHKIAYLFTSDEDIADYVSQLSVYMAFSILLNSVQPVLNGVAVGAGWQGLVAFVNVGCYYVIGIPLGISLGYFTDLQIKGLWVGMICGVGAQTLVLSYITWRANWDDQVGKASERLNKWLLNHSEEDDGISTTHAENNSVL